MGFIGASFSMHPNVYEQYKETKDGEIFEKLISDIILNKHSDDQNLTEFILSLPKEKQRLAVLSLIDKERKGDVNHLWSEMVSYVRDNVNKMEHIKDVIKIINKFVKDGEVEKKKHGEVMTPITLVREMLDSLPKEVWSNPDLKWLDPANGAGTFPFVVIYKLMNGLIEWESDEEKRYKHIVENMIYTCELQSRNVFLWLCGVDPKDEYTTNAYWGSFLDDGFDRHMKDVWNIDKFDIILGNPPYNDDQIMIGSKRGGGRSLWDKFVIKSMSLLNESKYLLFVHPSMWRKPESKNSKNKGLYNFFTKYQIVYLEIHGVKDGLSTFGAGTRYDWYLMQNKSYHKPITIIDEDGIENIIDIREWPFLPNKNFDIIKKIITNNNENKCDLIWNTYYHTATNRYEYVSLNKTNEHIYPLIHSTNKSGNRLYWTSVKNDKHFGFTKVIFGESGINNVVADINGEYGMTQGAMGIKINKDNISNLKMALESKKFKLVLEGTSWGNFRIDWRLFTYFREDFWKEFIEQ